MTATAITAQLHTRVFGTALTVEDHLPSTNTAARTLARAGAAEGTVVVARSQSAGRGRRGRSFFSPDGGVYMSVILRPGATMTAGDITACAAIAVARAIERLCVAKVGIKWVNDLFINDRKVCGILTEGECAADGTLTYAILGIGVNVAPTVFPDDIPATSLANEGHTVDRAALIAAVLEEWEALYTTYDPTTILTESRHRSVILGREVTVYQGSKAYTATALDITAHGHLTVRTATGDVITLSSGEVSIKL